ncbi:MAG TPA: hypothetical protein VKR30_04555 [Candidatus Limnocylindrales bacterium]|nr:hypothetical protein [Candidatus Limnocylindrales bacterium]
MLRPAVALLAAAVLLFIAGCSATVAPPTATPASSTNLAEPTAVAGLPVITVTRAAQLLDAGQLDGQAVAVAGFYDEVDPPCAEPGRYIGPLETWCRQVALADTKAGAQLCVTNGASDTSCGAPSGVHLSPFFESETGGSIGPYLTGFTGEPVAVVLIGHAGDARQWLCTAGTQADCARAFVVDRLAWAVGHDVPLTVPQTGTSISGAPITPKMTLAQVVAVVGQGDRVVTAAPFRAGDIAMEDPRWTLAGDSLVWLVRSLDQPPAPADEARSETVWLVDDATGRALGSHSLKIDPGYQPTRLWQVATLRGTGCCNGALLPFERVAASDGTVVYAGLVSGASTGGSDSTTFGGGYGSSPLVLPAGEYRIDEWVATDDQGVVGPPLDGCSAVVTLPVRGDVVIGAEFPGNGPCTLGPAPSPSPAL